MQISFDRLMSDRPIAVHFNFKDEAETFLQEMQSQYPERVMNWCSARYPINEYLNRGGVCYCPYFNIKDGQMRHGSRHTYETDRGYQIVEFADLIVEETDICEADIHIEFLFS